MARVGPLPCPQRNAGLETYRKVQTLAWSLKMIYWDFCCCYFFFPLETVELVLAKLIPFEGRH